MDIVLILLRLIHIVAGFIWFGLGFATTFVIVPAILASDENGQRFFKTMLVNTPFARLFPMVAGINMLAGLLMYAVSDVTTHFTNTGNIVLGIGAAAGILAGIHGGATTGRATSEVGEALDKNISNGAEPIAPEAKAELRQQIEKLLYHSRVSFVLITIALIGMGSARYLS